MLFRCEVNFWKIASGQGCEPCDCDPVGSVHTDSCNEFDGTCECKPGFGGRQCNQCEANHWGDPNVECHSCDCNEHGSTSYQCDPRTGKCDCLEGKKNSDRICVYSQSCTSHWLMVMPR